MDDLEPLTLLLPPPECWDYSCVCHHTQLRWFWGLKPGFVHAKWTLYQLNHTVSPEKLACHPDALSSFSENLWFPPVTQGTFGDISGCRQLMGDEYVWHLMRRCLGQH